MLQQDFHQMENFISEEMLEKFHHIHKQLIIRKNRLKGRQCNTYVLHYLLHMLQNVIHSVTKCNLLQKSNTFYKCNYICNIQRKKHQINFVHF